MQTLLERLASLHAIRTREALKGGRFEVFQLYRTCGKDEQTFYLVVVSLCPTVSALDEYAVGYRRHINAIVEDITEPIHWSC